MSRLLPNWFVNVRRHVRGPVKEEQHCTARITNSKASYKAARVKTVKLTDTERSNPDTHMDTRSPHRQHRQRHSTAQEEKPSQPVVWGRLMSVGGRYPHSTLALQMGQQNSTSLSFWQEPLRSPINLHWWRWAALPLLIDCQTCWLPFVCNGA